MSTSLHAVFNKVFGNVDFVIVVLDINCQKKRFSASSQKSLSEKPIFGQFEVIFINV